MSSKHTEAAETHRPPLTPEQFEASPDFRDFRGIMRRLLTVRKPVLDRKVRKAKSEVATGRESECSGEKASHFSLGIHSR